MNNLIDRVGGDIELAPGLRTSAYFDEAFMRTEQTRLFACGWF